NFMPPKPDLSYIGLDKFDVKLVVENKSSEEVTNAVRKNLDAPIVEDWVSDNKEENVNQPKIVKKIVKPSIPKIKTPALSFVKPFGCPVSILITLDQFGKFDGKADEGFFVRYLMNSKSFGVFNSRKRIVEENLHIRFSENTPNIVSSGPDWLFDIDALTRTMNYEPIVAGTQSNGFVGTKARDNAGQARKEKEHVDEDPSKGSECKDQEKDDIVNSTNNVSDAGINRVNTVSENISNELPLLNQVIKYLHLTTQTRNMSKNLEKIGHTKEDGIEYDEVFTPVTRIDAIRLFLAYASFKDFVVYQMDVKSVFPNGKIEEEIVHNCKKGLGYESYNVISPPYARNFMPPKPDLSYIGLDKFDVKPVVENKSSEEVTNAVRKNLDAPIVEDYVSDNKEENVNQPKIVKKIVKPSIPKIKFVKPRQ
nr:retrovirus-related Pol polyprotein from transposon TNT 1-94 [Tanacetum cinerariifolium]